MSLNDYRVSAILPSQGQITADVWQKPDALLAAVLDDPEYGILIFDMCLNTVHVTRKVYELLGTPAVLDSEAPAVLELLTSGNLDEESRRAAQACILQGSELNVESTILRTRGAEQRHIQMSLRGVGSHYRVLTFRERFVAAPELARKAGEDDATDWLTGLASRRMFEHAVTEALTQKPHEPFAIILMDLDRFKPVNDRLGHAAGDTVLRLTAERILSSVRRTDLVARLGGDEFAVLIWPPESPTATTLNELIAVASRTLETVRRTYLVNGNLVNIGVSLGIAIAPGHGTTCHELMKRADLALYHSKNCGRATFHFFEPAMEARVVEKGEHELELRRALALRQLEVHYQPQVDIQSGRLVAFEALVRWRHPLRGLIPPCDFLPLAEEIGVIVQMGDWVLKTACKQAMSWDSNVVIAVNVSPMQFENGHFADTVRRVLGATGLPGARLEIEITESILLRNEEKILATLYALREMNVRIAMDDFGTGYASLSQLAQFPFDKIKIDKSLSGMDGNNPKHRAIVRAIAAMGESLGVSTMAEGVESAAQMQRLQTDGCNSVQGFLFSKAVPASELKSLIKDLGRASENFCGQGEVNE